MSREGQRGKKPWDEVKSRREGRGRRLTISRIREREFEDEVESSQNADWPGGADETKPDKE